MTEAEWLACEQPEPMLPHLRTACVHRRKGGRRKLRLFACACWRRVWHLIGDGQDRWPASQALVEVMEGYADGDGMGGSMAAAQDAGWQLGSRSATVAAVGAIDQATWPAMQEELDRGDYPAPPGYLVSAREAEVRVRVRSLEHRAQSALVRCIFGNPFRPVTLDPAHRISIVASLARAVYDERHLPSGELDPLRLAILADALEEIGATDELVAHLRSPGPHVRGCFVIDLCLGLS
jgi:hypothetical protein